jgi:POT family proton-dependent oligopeptide transporter
LATITDTVDVQGDVALRRGAETRQPPGLWLLFGVEMWERFSYYGMRAILVLYLVNQLQWSDADASRLYGNYTALVYLTPILGGWLADRVLGNRRSLIAGSAIIAAGHFCLALPGMATFYLGLGLIIVGTGFFKPTSAAMVGELYGPDDTRRDAGFTIYYMAVNLGAFLAPLIVGFLGEKVGWHYGFGAAGVGMVLGLLLFLWGRERYLPGIGLSPLQRVKESREAAERQPLTRREKSRIAVIFILAFFVIFFWTAFEQAGASMNLFADRHTARTLGGFEFPASWFQSVNPLVILIFAPLFARLWVDLGRRGREPSAPTKMGAGLILLGLGFGLMVLGAGRADTGALVSPLWLVGAYTLNTWGELSLSPVGLSMVSRLSPVRLVAMMMGVWYLANFASNWLAGQLSALMGSFESLRSFFSIFMIAPIAAGVVLLLLSPVLQRMMGDRK